MAKARIIAIGNELLRGDILDTNSYYLANSLNDLGFSLKGVSLAEDNLDDIVRELAFGTQDSELIITTGGIGPTSDDITRDAIAKFIGKELLLSEESLERLYEHSRKRGRELQEN